MKTNNQTNTAQGGQTGSQQTGNFPLSNICYDVITVLHEKAKGLEAYDKYLKDAQSEQEVSQLLQKIRRQDEQAIQELQQCLTKLLGRQQTGGAAKQTTAGS
jgi:hypothetical protein